MAVYEGSENYIFVSYAHKDSAVVLPIIDALQTAGFRVWYDEGIQAGTEWPEYIEDHLNQSRCVLVCMSPSAVDSINCRNEINYACMLKKDILVVYLEDTVLAKGMNLQLNSQQSLFRTRHNSDVSFLEEVIRANILSPCKIGNEDLSFLSNIKIPSGDQKKASGKDDTGYESTVKARMMNMPTIARVGSMGSNNPSEAWPKGTYSQVIDVNRFKAIRFHCNMIHPVTSAGEKTVGLRIYDSHAALVFEDISKIVFREGDDRFALAWIIRDAAGLAQTADTYTAVFWVDDSRAFEYSFTIVTEPRGTAKENKELVSLQKKMQYPKLFVLQLIALIAGFGLMGCIGSFAIVGILIFLVVWVIFVTYAIRKTKAVVVKNGFLALLLATILSPYYTIYLFIMLIVYLTSRKLWMARIQELQNML